MNKLIFIFLSVLVVIAIFGRLMTYAAPQPSAAQAATAHRRINAETPKLLNRSYETIMRSMSIDEREKFLKGMASLMETYGKDNTDADAAFRKHINGMTVAAIMAAAKEAQPGN